ARLRPRRRNVSVGSTGRRPGWPRLSRDPLALLPGHRAAEDVLIRISTSHPAVPTSRAGLRFTRTDPSCSVVLGRCELAELRFDRLATATERALGLDTQPVRAVRGLTGRAPARPARKGRSIGRASVRFAAR